MIRPTNVAPGVARFAAETPTLPPATHTNSYALGERDVLLVEPATPYENEQREWVEWARGMASSGRNLVALFATHHHADHVGGAAFFAEALGLPLWGHERTARFIEHPVARTLVDGEKLRFDGPSPAVWSVLHTPGHASDHLCLYDDTNKSLVIGDMVASVGTILVAPGDGDMSEYLRQLSRLEKLEAKVALPAHGDPIDNPSRLLRAYQAHRSLRESLVLKAVDASGGGTLEELVPVAYSDTKPELYPLAKLSLEAHLIKLEKDGLVTRQDARFVRTLA